MTRHSAHFARSLGPALAFIGVLACITCVSFVARAARVRVHGAAKLTAEVQHGSPITISGMLVDDTGAPLAGERVLVSVLRDDAPDDVAVRRAVREAKPCGGNDLVPLADDAMARRTDEAGRFCVTLALPQDHFRLRVSWAGEKLVDGATIEQRFDLTRAPLRLAFDPEAHAVSLDAKTTQLEAIATTDDADGILRPAPGRVVALSTEAGAEIARETTNGSGRARFVVPTARLGPPGRGELRLVYAGDATTSFAETRDPIDRQAHVELKLAEPLSGAGSEDGVLAQLDVLTLQGAPVSEGTVQATLADTVVGAAPVAQGRARVVLTFAEHGGAPADVRVRYVPVSPYYLPQGDLALKVPPPSTSPWRRAPLALLALLVVAFLAIGRFRRPVTLVKEAAPKEPEPVGHARVDVVKHVQHARIGWSGEVIDAHDGVPVAGATVSLERPAFSGRGAIALTHADADGRFRMPFVDTVPGDELVAHGPLHTEIRKPVPPEGELRIALVLRKRAILASLVAWAKARGGAFAGKTEPTPGLVRRLSSNDYRTARWADAVEKAAFDAVTVDRRTEQEIEALRPDRRQVPDPIKDQTSGR